MGKPTYNEPRPIPGVPVELPTVQSIPGILDRLYALDYIKYNTIKRTLLLMPPGLNTAEVVDLAKEYCKRRAINFSWIEPAITEIEGDPNVPRS